MPFRWVKEGEGATLPLFHMEVPRVGTYMLMTCVGVYFKIDQNRCFFAHLTPKSPDAKLSWVVTEQAGDDIGSQVKQRLCNFLRVDNWDIKDPEFGKDLLLQCPCLRDRVFNGKQYYTPGKFVVKAVREFFMACGLLLKEDLGQRQAVPQAPQDNEHRRQSSKSDFLIHTATTTVVDDDHHIMVVSPLTGAMWRFGEVRNPPSRSIHEEDLGDFVPVALDLQAGLCGFGVSEDDRTSLPQSLLTTDAERAETLEKVKWERRQYESFGTGIENAIATRLWPLIHSTRLTTVPTHPADIYRTE